MTSFCCLINNSFMCYQVNRINILVHGIFFQNSLHIVARLSYLEISFFADNYIESSLITPVLINIETKHCINN